MAEIAKELREAMRGVTPGPWTLYEISKTPAILHVHGPSTVVAGTDGICQPERYNDRQFTEDEANMRYIAACSPERVTDVLDALDAAQDGGWQPIETAPKDGTEILVCVTYNLGSDKWETTMWVDRQSPVAIWPVYRRRIDIPFPPSEWRPLPAPPSLPSRNSNG